MSTRTIAAAMKTALEAATVRYIVFARFDFLSGVERVHTSFGDRTWTHPVFGSETYSGIGRLGALQGGVRETLQMVQQPVRLRLAGVNNSELDKVLNDDYHRREAEVWVGAVNIDTGAIIADPVNIFSGFMDKADIELGNKSSVIVMSCTSRGDKIKESSKILYTDEEHQKVSPGDLCFQYFYRMMSLNLRWGDFRFVPPFSTSDPTVPSENILGEE